MSVRTGSMYIYLYIQHYLLSVSLSILPVFSKPKYCYITKITITGNSKFSKRKKSTLTSKRIIKANQGVNVFISYSLLFYTKLFWIESK